MLRKLNSLNSETMQKSNSEIPKPKRNTKKRKKVVETAIFLLSFRWEKPKKITFGFRFAPNESPVYVNENVNP